MMKSQNYFFSSKSMQFWVCGNQSKSKVEFSAETITDEIINKIVLNLINDKYILRIPIISVNCSSSRWSSRDSFVLLSDT